MRLANDFFCLFLFLKAIFSRTSQKLSPALWPIVILCFVRSRFQNQIGTLSSSSKSSNADLVSNIELDNSSHTPSQNRTNDLPVNHTYSPKTPISPPISIPSANWSKAAPYIFNSDINSEGLTTKIAADGKIHLKIINATQFRHVQKCLLDNNNEFHTYTVSTEEQIWCQII